MSSGRMVRVTRIDTGEAPNLNALAHLCVNMIYKMASDGYLNEAEILVGRCRQAVRMAEEEQE